MKQQLIISICLIFITTTTFCQNMEFPDHDKKFSFEIEQEKSGGKLSNSSASYYYTFIGNYQKALENYELHLDWGFDTISYKDSLEFMNYRAVDAIQYLTGRTKDEQIVIISEAHQKPQHRVFSAELLEGLYKSGFRYLGMESITPNHVDSSKFIMDTLLIQRGFPLNSYLTGYYTQEPQMGNMVRKALSLGFVIFGYERTNKNIDRDLRQAMNIEKFMHAHPGGKIVIHCGWYHAVESDYPKRRNDNYLAFHLKNRTGIDPLTIYQDILSEKVLIDESPYYKLINSNQASVLLDDKGDVFNGFGEQKHFDILIYHPRTAFLKNRPDWLIKIKGNQFVQIEKNRITDDEYPVLIEAFPEGEKNSVPVDVVELLTGDDKTELLLKKGNYIIRITDKHKKTRAYEKKVD